MNINDVKIEKGKYYIIENFYIVKALKDVPLNDGSKIKSYLVEMEDKSSCYMTEDMFTSEATKKDYPELYI